VAKEILMGKDIHWTKITLNTNDLILRHIFEKISVKPENV